MPDPKQAEEEVLEVQRRLMERMVETVREEHRMQMDRLEVSLAERHADHSLAFFLSLYVGGLCVGVV